MVDPLESHWSMVKHMLWYLSGTITHGLNLALAISMQRFSLRAYDDSNWANDQGDRSSTSGFCVYF